ncbi:MAG: hypothetical protein Q9191_000748 [Dirinaria sp. TL-2023a]
MGLLMDDIHAPSVPSGAVTGHRSSDKPKEGVPLFELMNQKQQLEEELKALGSVLDSDTNNLPVRTTRAQVIRLRNDYKGLMSEIEAGLHAHHASLRETSEPPPSQSISDLRQVSSNGSSSIGLLQTPFARVNSVVSGSPADEAGLRAGDRIRRFGAANWINHEKLGKVAEVVQENEGRPILVDISRDDFRNDNVPNEMQLQLTPRRNWGGRGLLGCHLLPF